MSNLHKKAGKWVYVLEMVSCAGLLALSPATRSLAAEDATDTGTLEEVTVTAQRVEENLQTVPITVNTISGDAATQRGAVSLQTLQSTVPNLLNVGSNASNTYVRGVGSNASSINNEPAVATYVDGVYQAQSIGLFGLYNNLQRIEVLKGPQGTLFGRNTTGGVIQIITVDPKHDVSGKLDVGYGNYNTTHADAYLTGGLTENIAADVSVIYEDQADGWGHNLTTGAEIYRSVNASIRSKLLYTPTDSTKITASFDQGHVRITNGLGMYPGSVDPNDHVTTYAGRFNAYGDSTEIVDNQYGGSIKLDQDLGPVHFASITAQRHESGVYFNDNDRTPARLNYFQTFTKTDFGTEELQFSNSHPGRITWLGGVFLFASAVAPAGPRVQLGTAVPAGGDLNIYGKQQTRSGSIYGQATADLFDNTKLTLGLRNTDEKLTFDGKFTNAAGVLVTSAGSPVNAVPFHSVTKYEPWTYRAALDHQFTPDQMAYVSFTHGFKSGGYNGTSPNLAPFLPETVNAYEVGEKSELMDHRLRLNAALFYYNYTNIQVAIVPGGAGQIFTNAGAARNYGLDAGVDFVATDRLTLSAGLGILNAKYTKFLNAQGFGPTGVAINLPSAAGKYLPYAPPETAYISPTYKLPTSVGDFVATANLSYQDHFYIVPTNYPAIHSYFKLAASVEWDTQSEHPFGVRLWGRNLLNTYTITGLSVSNGGWYGSWGEPRMYGLLLLKKF